MTNVKAQIQDILSRLTALEGIIFILKKENILYSPFFIIY